MKSNLDYRNFVRVEGEIVYDYTGKLKQRTKSFEPSDIKNWTIEEKSSLYDITLSSKTGSYEEINRAFVKAGHSNLRPVHVAIVKRYIKYDAREEYLTNKSLTSVVSSKK